MQVKNIRNANVGDNYIFGKYYFLNKESDKKKELLWRVLKVEEHKALIITELVIDSMVYHKPFEETSWETSYVRHWLNNDFIEEAFDDEEQKAIEAVIINDKETENYEPIVDVTDKVFLLSYDEAKELFNDNNRSTSHTEYTLSKGCYLDTDNNKNPWWLRSLKHNKTNAAYVDTDDSIASDGEEVNYYDTGIRPALWINLDYVKPEKEGLGSFFKKLFAK